MLKTHEAHILIKWNVCLLSSFKIHVCFFSNELSTKIWHNSSFDRLDSLNKTGHWIRRTVDRADPCPSCTLEQLLPTHAYMNMQEAHIGSQSCDMIVLYFHDLHPSGL